MKSTHKSNVRINGGRVVVPVYVPTSTEKTGIFSGICFKRVFAGILVGGCTLVAGCIAFLYYAN